MDTLAGLSRRLWPVSDLASTVTRGLLIHQLPVDYLINPSLYDFVEPRRQSGAAIIAIYYILLFPVLVYFGRLLQTILLNPGTVPRGEAYYNRTREMEKTVNVEPRNTDIAESRNTDIAESESHDSGSYAKYSSYPLGRSDEEMLESSLEDWWTRDVFVCQHDGLPPWCTTCRNYKPDRGHHCSEIQRCVRKMDHFCPW